MKASMSNDSKKWIEPSFAACQSASALFAGPGLSISFPEPLSLLALVLAS
jgi:hypothetical protein